MGAIREQLDRMGVPDWRHPPPAPAAGADGECQPWMHCSEEASRYWSTEGFGGHKQDALLPPAGLAGIAFIGHRITGRVNVDARLAPTIRGLWAHGIPTISSCQGGPWWWGELPRPELGGSWACPDERRGYLTIPATHAGAFLRLLIGAARPLIDGTFEALVLGWATSTAATITRTTGRGARRRTATTRGSRSRPRTRPTSRSPSWPSSHPSTFRKSSGESLAASRMWPKGRRLPMHGRDGPLAHHQHQPHPQGGPDARA